MRDLAVLTFLTLDGVMQAPVQPEEDTSGGFSSGGWATDYWKEVMVQVERGTLQRDLTLVKTEANSNGVIMSIYRRSDELSDSAKLSTPAQPNAT